ncbi:MAG: hypothetical protein RL220_1691 [Bacteroidota bacterium]|jgi:triosephosphate isomerase
MRSKIIAGNWKMNNTLEEGMNLAAAINESREEYSPDVDIILAPPSLYLANLLMMHDPCFSVAAQNCSQHDYGAFTGEISAAMLHSMSVPYCIIGHSERRTYFHETDELLRLKLEACQRNQVKPIFCIGESLEDRKAGNYLEVVHAQISAALITGDKHIIDGCVLAYEPVWAIGTGLNANAEQIEEMHSFIRLLIEENFGTSVASGIRILYGGSMKPSNAAEILACPNVDGGLIGGASLHSRDFISLIKTAGA